MKTKIKALLLAATLTLPAAAQELRSNYFMETSDYRHETNPALLDHSYVAMPLLMGNFNLGTTGNVGLSNFVYKMQPDWQGYGVDGRTLTTFMHPNVDAGSFLDGLRDNNRISLNLKYQLAGVAFKAFGGFNVVELNLRSNTGLALPKQLFNFMKTAGAQEEYDISNLGVRTENFMELGLGHSRKIDDKLTVGAKVKLLFGLAYADLSADNLKLKLSQDQWQITGDVKATAAMMGTELELDESTDKLDPETGRPRVDGLGDFKAGLAGFGLGFDLGATYQVLPDLLVSASITDLGFISWANANQASSAGQWTFEGFKEDVYAGGKKTDTNQMDDQLEAIGDDLEDIFAVYNDGKKSVTRALAATINVGAEYTLPQYRPLRFGFLYSSRLAGKHSWHQGQISATVRPVKWFEGSVNCAVTSTGFTGGMVLDFHARHFNFFVGTDRFFGKLSKQFVPLNNLNSNVSLGFAFPL